MEYFGVPDEYRMFFEREVFFPSLSIAGEVEKEPTYWFECLMRLQDSERRFPTSGNYRIFKDNTLYQFWRRAPGIVLAGRPVANRFFKPHQTMLKFPSVGDAQWERFLRDTRRKFERCITFMGPSGPVWPVSEDLTIDRDAEDLALQLGWITRAGILHMCWSFNWLEVSADCPLTCSNTDF